MSRKLSIGQAAKKMGVSISTLRRWEVEGKLLPEKTEAGHRRYDEDSLLLKPAVTYAASSRHTLAYARVSSHDQRADLERQKQVLELHCAAQGWQYELITDLGSGVNYHKKGLKRLIQLILDEDISRLVLTHQDRLLRFGAELIFAICEAKNVEVVILNRGESTSFEEDLASDMLEMVNVLSEQFSSSFSRKNQKLLEDVKKAVEASQSC